MDERRAPGSATWGIPSVIGVVGILILVIGILNDSGPAGGIGALLTVGSLVVLIYQLNRNTQRRLVEREAPIPLRPPSTTPITDIERRQLFDHYLSQDVALLRSRVESVTPYSAVVITGQRVNHVLHLLVSVLLCGLWIPVWIIMAMGGGEKRSVLMVDSYGHITKR